jgi:hypothetical protein
MTLNYQIIGPVTPSSSTPNISAARSAASAHDRASDAPLPFCIPTAPPNYGTPTQRFLQHEVLYPQLRSGFAFLARGGGQEANKNINSTMFQD